ncbi:MAG: (2Fe-2S)-binding protein [Acetobacteraceae bacterium]|nr:(2Fe-2S)-binding protein [Acetobacteraceae bacterium]MBV8521328.1 (2Fe-2S)-binding protein [Acetobacteraceae bacterium]
MPKTAQLTVNGKPALVPADDGQIPLLYVLRNDLGLHGPRFGCGLGQCGACMVLMDGKATRSCITPLASVGQAKITTLEGLGSPEQPSAVQKAFIDEQAVQCGYCINGMIIQATDLLSRNHFPSASDIKQALANNLCRCGTHLRIVRAVQRASRSI